MKEGERQLVFLGPPGVGKGTQAKRLAGWLGVAHISTGEILRSKVAAGDPLGQVAKAFIDQGELAPDDLVVEIVRERLAQSDAEKGFIIDGFPRNLAQARKLDELAGEAGVSRVVNFTAPKKTLVERLGGRMQCSECQDIFHADNRPPKQQGRCDRCGGKLVLRKDDRPRAIRKRLAVYLKSTVPLVSYYRTRGLLEEVRADRSPDEVHEELKKLFSI